MNKVDMYKHTTDVFDDVKHIIETSQKQAYQAVNTTLILRNWYIGKRIYEEEMKCKDRAQYGEEIIKQLSKELQKQYGKGYNYSSIYRFVKFYKLFPNILATVWPKSHLLSWSHYKILLQVEDNTARNWYENEAYNESWSVRTLQRNISSQYYYRLLHSQNKEPVIQEMQEITAIYQNDKLEFIKNPVIMEFLGLSNEPSYTESKLESCIITNLQKFLIELGKGYAFVARQQHIHTQKQDNT